MTDEKKNEIALEMVSVITVTEMRQLLFILPKINGNWGTSATVIPFPEQFHFFSSVIRVPIC